MEHNVPPFQLLTAPQILSVKIFGLIIPSHSLFQRSTLLAGPDLVCSILQRADVSQLSQPSNQTACCQLSVTWFWASVFPSMSDYGYNNVSNSSLRTKWAKPFKHSTSEVHSIDCTYLKCFKKYFWNRFWNPIIPPSIFTRRRMDGWL